MTRKLLLRVAAFFTLFTFAGHTTGVIKGPPAEQTAVTNVYEVMRQTMVNLPMGSPKSIGTLMVGANLCLSVLLLLSGLLFILLSMTKEKPAGQDNRVLLLNSLAMLATAAVSFVCFFPMPAICTGLAGILGLIALRRA
jgi:uncharacterized iron-regulated membrane protein